MEDKIKRDKGEEVITFEVVEVYGIGMSRSGDSIPLISCPQNDNVVCTGLKSLDRVLLKVKEIQPCVKLSREGFEEQFMALLISIRVGIFIGG